MLSPLELFAIANPFRSVVSSGPCPEARCLVMILSQRPRRYNRKIAAPDRGSLVFLGILGRIRISSDSKFVCQGALVPFHMAPFLGFFGGHPQITVQRLLNDFQRLTGVFHIKLIHPLTCAFNVTG